ncbi:unnamed protein product [Pedinophyceae sp. YPF-701]|nr:unnamed protein product [Pedinophyceae sp. YPF-701]
MKRKMTRIGTHNGKFHCDEALGVFLLKLLPEYAAADVVRTRDPAVLKDLDVVIDVGGEYDAARGRFDHHQKEFQDVFGHGFNTRLSSAGLVYKHFGRKIIAQQLGKSESDPSVDELYLVMYKNFIEAVDANDNGVALYEVDAKPRYVSNTDLPSRVSKMAARWNEPCSAEEEDERFSKASQMAGGEFLADLEYWSKGWLPARGLVSAALKARKDVHPSGKILRFDQVCPWKEHLFDLEREEGCVGEAIYVLYKDQREGKWRVQAVPLSPSSFDGRKMLPEPWRGLRDDKLDEVSGIKGCVFVHAAGFIGGHATYEGALEMAVRALEM